MRRFSSEELARRNHRRGYVIAGATVLQVVGMFVLVFYSAYEIGDARLRAEKAERLLELREHELAVCWSEVPR